MWPDELIEFKIRQRGISFNPERLTMAERDRILDNFYCKDLTIDEHSLVVAQEIQRKQNLQEIREEAIKETRRSAQFYPYPPIKETAVKPTIPPQEAKPMKLSHSQIAVLATICTPLASQDDLTAYLNVPGRELMIKALEEEQAKIQQANAKEAALSIIALSKRVQEAKDVHVQNIRSLRDQIDRSKKQLDQLDNLLAYGNETGNYLPLIVATQGGYEVTPYVKDKSLLTVPENWKPKAATVKKGK